MTQHTERPTTEVKDVILASMDGMFEQLVTRLDGLTDHEYLWEPVDGMWSVRVVDGVPTVDSAGVRSIDPAPVTTIGWRLWHLAIDCFDDYTRRLNGDLEDATDRWTMQADEAVETLRQTWGAYRGELVGRGWWDQLGDSWGPWSKHSVADMAMHAGNELVHHGAEVGLLRDLYRAADGQRMG